MRNTIWLLLIFVTALGVAAQCTTPLTSSLKSRPVSENHPGLVYYSERQNSDGVVTGGLYLLDLTTNEERYLTPESTLSLYRVDFSWSSAAQKLIYTEEGVRSEDQEIFQLDLSGNKVRLTNNDVMDSYPKWAPDGQTIAFISRGEDPVNNLYLMNSEGIRPLLATASILAGNFAWSPDGQKLAVSVHPYSTVHPSDPPIGPEENLYVINVETGEVLLHLPGDRVRSGFSWSSDSSKLIYLSDLVIPQTVPIALYKSLYSLDMVQGEETLIANFESVGRPYSSPVEDVIAFTASTDMVPTSPEEDASYDMNIYLIRSDDTELKQLTHEGFWGIGSWSPNGTKLVATTASADPSNSEIYVLDIESQDLEQITHDNYFDAFPVWVEY